MNKFSTTMQMRQTLHERFPLCFMAKGVAKKPLAVGISRKIREVAEDLDPQLIAWAINNYVRGRKYQDNMIEGAQRVNLDGSPAGFVTAQDALYARIVLGRLERRWNRKGNDTTASPAEGARL